MIQKRHDWKSCSNIKEPKICIPKADRDIIALIQPSMEDGPWIAGGACLHWIQHPNQSVAGVSDIDIYCKNERQIRNVRRRLSLCCTESYETKNAVSFVKNVVVDSTPYVYTIQIIKITVGQTAESIVDTFDIEACKVATDGIDMYASEQTLSDIQDKIIRIYLIREESVRRILKYMIKGFSLDPTTYKRLGNTQDIVWDFNYSSEEY